MRTERSKECSGTVIELGLFESVCGCTFLFNICIIFVTFIALITLIGGTFREYGKLFLLLYSACILLFAVLLGICHIVCKCSKNKLVLYEDRFVFKNKIYNVCDIKKAVYYVCKWYMIPFVRVYKNEQAGCVEIKVEGKKMIAFSVAYKDYLKLKKIIGNIEAR